MLDHRVPLSTRSLSHAHIRAHHPTMRLERRSSPPCPNADGQTIGTGLPLTLSCGATLPGEILVTLPEATTLEQCANFCGTFHPRCNGINYSEADGCRLIGGVGGAGTARSSLSDDAATAEYPALPPSSCRDGVQMVPGREAFEGMCGQVINDGDLVQRHRETYEACAEDCAGTTDCVAFSFEASMDRGFMNCYLKSAFLDGAMTFVEGVDSGVMSAGNASSTPGNGSSEIPSSGGFFSIKPDGNTKPSSTQASEVQSIPESSPPPPENPSPTQSPVVTQVVTTALDSSETSSDSDTGDASLSWVAAPVVGGVAALLVVGVLLVMFRKRRNGGGKGEPAPSVWGATFGALRGSRGKGMERLGDAEGRGVPVYEVKGGKVALRKGGEGRRSMTGLFMTKG